MRHLTLCILLAAMPCAVAQAADRLAEIRDQQQVLAQELDSGVLEVTPRQAMLIRKDQARIAKLLDGKAALADLGVAERVELDNALERINAAVVGTRGADEDADICRYERNTSSKIRKLDCATASQRQNSRDGARAYLEKPRVCMPPGCGQ